MFKERLQTTAHNLIQAASALAFFIVFICGLVMSPDWLKEVIKWCLVGIIGTILLVVLIGWVYWQFIEPYQEWKRNKSN